MLELYSLINYNYRLAMNIIFQEKNNKNILRINLLWEIYDKVYRTFYYFFINCVLHLFYISKIYNKLMFIINLYAFFFSGRAGC